jgi:hypothetical protein
MAGHPGGFASNSTTTSSSSALILFVWWASCCCVQVAAVPLLDKIAGAVGNYNAAMSCLTLLTH